MKPIGTMYFLKISFEHGTTAFRMANASFVLLSKKLISFLWISVPFVLQRLKKKKHKADYVVVQFYPWFKFYFLLF